MTDIARDRWGRPLITPPGGGKPIAYTRCTTFVGALEDTYNLERWKCRQTIKGLTSRNDLIALAKASTHDDKALNGIVDQAMEAAQSDKAANLGTALHSLTELLDRGMAVEMPDDMADDLAAYTTATSNLRHEHIETLTVNDKLQVAGTPDRITRLPDGRLVIADLKTGRIDYSINKIAMQLAMYANSHLYNPETNERTEHKADKTVGLVIHLPVGTGECTLHAVDLTAGWQAVQLAAQVRAWRSRKDIGKPWPEHTVIEQQAVADDHTHDLILTEIAACDSVDQLEGVYANHMATWTQIHTEAAAARKAAITNTTTGRTA